MADQLCMERMTCGQTFLQCSHEAFQSAVNTPKLLKSPCVFQCKMKLNILGAAIADQLAGAVAANVWQGVRGPGAND